MAEIDAKAVAALRKQTGAGVMDVKQALTEAGGDTGRATELLKERGLAKAAKKGEREASEGVVHSYVHGGGRVGVLLEVNCETDFVARNDEFKALANELAMQIAAQDPETVEGDDETALLAQPYIKDPKRTVEEVLKEHISKLGENIKVTRFTRYELGG
mgnify:CR=1 FL=1